MTELYDEAERLKYDGQHEAAIDKLLELLAADEAHALAHSALAVLYGKVGQHDKAVEHAIRTSDLEPDDPFSWTALSVVYQRAYAGTNNEQYIQMAEDAMAKSKMMSGHH
jgi:tetratricopeptide (TPR) repeat protein